MTTATIRKARIADANPIQQLINRLALEQILLPRSPASVLENIRDFVVAEHSSLPHKVFNDCLNCPKYQACDEIAVMRVLPTDAVEMLSDYPMPKRP